MEKKNVPEIRFEGFTDDWEKCKIGDIGEIVSGGTPDTNNPNYWDGDINWYAPAEIVDQIYVSKSERKITELGLQKSSAKMLPANRTILFTSRAGIGKTAILQHSACTNQGFQSLVLKNGIDPYFIYSMGNQLKEKAEAVASGSTFLEISGKMLANLNLMMPNRDEQERIAAHFKNLDKLIILYQRKYKKLKLFKEAMLDKMFPKNGQKVPEIRFKGFTDDWEQHKLSDWVLIERGGSPRPIDEYITDSPDGLNWVKIGDTPEQGNYITKTAEKIKPEGLSKTRQVQPGDLILSNSMSFGKPYIMSINGCIHDGWLLIRDTQHRFDLKFLCYLLGTTQMIDQYKAFAAGSTVNNLNKELVGNTLVTIPCKEEQRTIGKYFEQLDHLITLHQRKLEKLKNIKQAYLNEMFV